VLETVRAVQTRARIHVVRQRVRVHRRFPAPVAPHPRPRVVAAVTHVADPARTADSADRLERTLDGLFESLGHTQLVLVLNTLPGRHAAEALPAHQRDRLVVAEHEGVEPMFAGFEAQREFESRCDDADWFLYFEDDVVLGDSLLLEKLAYFNDGAPPEALLIPHRYELWNGRRVYIDMLSKRGVPVAERSWNRLTMLDVGGWKFAEFENPHSGCYFLSRAQLRRWLESGRRWYGLSSYVGPRESAATGALEECFRLYKPHPENMTDLEVRHLGTKYAEYYSQFYDLARADERS
jgi:hypothetical protein